MFVEFKEIFGDFSFSDERNFLSFFHEYLDFIFKDILIVKLAILWRWSQLNTDVLPLEIKLFVLIFKLGLKLHDVFKASLDYPFNLITRLNDNFVINFG